MYRLRARVSNSLMASAATAVLLSLLLSQATVSPARVIRASSQLRATTQVTLESGAGLPNGFEPGLVLDGVPQSAWCEGGRGDGTDEWIELQLLRPANELSIVTGFWKGRLAEPSRTFGAYGRPTVIELLDASGKIEARLRLDGSVPAHRVRLPLATGRHRLRFAEVQRGEKFFDACLGELTFSRAEVLPFVAPQGMPEVARRFARPLRCVREVPKKSAAPEEVVVEPLEVGRSARLRISVKDGDGLWHPWSTAALDWKAGEEKARVENRSGPLGGFQVTGAVDDAQEARWRGTWGGPARPSTRFEVRFGESSSDGVETALTWWTSDDQSARGDARYLCRDAR